MTRTETARNPDKLAGLSLTGSGTDLGSGA
ncbi:MAG: hypothetical protein JWP62_3842 [Blastococcus sp.]|jgi:hypothetical protein|nr:hypothetical protein [Blastococcus sp.]